MEEKSTTTVEATNNGATTNNTQKVVIANTANFTRKRLIQLPYTEVKIDNLTKNDRIAVMAKVIEGLQSGDKESLDIASNLTNPDYKVKVPIDGLIGTDFLLAYWALVRAKSDKELLELYQESFDKGSEESRKIALFLGSKIKVTPNPIIEEKK